MCFFKKKKKCMREEELITLRGKTEDQILFEIYEMYKEMSEFNRRLESRLVRNLDTANTMLRELDRVRDTEEDGHGHGNEEDHYTKSAPPAEKKAEK